MAAVATFRDFLTDPKTGGSSGRVWYCNGEYVVHVAVIPDDAPKDWSMGPKMVAGQFGVFLANACCPNGRSPYAIATAKTEAEARARAAGYFREGPLDGWKEE